MVNGRLRCLGSSQHLKLTFGSGYEIDMKTQYATISQLSSIAQNLQSAGVISLYSSPSKSGRFSESDESGGELGLEAILSNTSVKMSDIRAICSALMESERSQMIAPNREGANLYTSLETDGFISLRSFLEWWIAEDYSCRISDFMREEFQGAQLLERSTSHSFRYRIPSDGSTLASIFGKFESSKASLHLEDYSVGQTTLEQIFNQFAASQDNPEVEAEHLQQQAQRVQGVHKKASNNASNPSTSSSKSSFGVEADTMKPLPTTGPFVSQAIPFKRTSTNTSFSKTASLTGGVF